MECFFIKFEDNESLPKNFNFLTEKYRSLFHLEKIPGWKTKFEDFGNSFQNLYFVFDENKNQKYFFGRVRLNVEGKILKFVLIVEQEKPYEIKLQIKGRGNKIKLNGEEKKMMAEFLKVQLLENYILEMVCGGKA